VRGAKRTLASGAAVLGFLCMVGPTGPLGAQQGPSLESCESGRIESVFIDNHSIFDLSEYDPERSFLWALRLANRLHIRTRQSFIERELLFGEGDCYDPFLLDESGRILRDYGFIAQADVYAVQLDEDRHHVIVDTQDDWTTKVDLGVSLDDGFSVEKLEVTEENFLGRGMLLELSFEERRERRDLGLKVQSSRLLGSRWDAMFTVGNTRLGDFIGASLAYPFVGEIGRFAAFQSFSHREDFFSYSLPMDEGYTNALLPMMTERFSFALAARDGEPGDFTMLGLGVSQENLEFPGFPGSVEWVLDGNFGDSEPADSATQAAVASQVTDEQRTRFNLLLAWRNIRFTRHRGLDALKGIQDIQTGTDIGLTIGVSSGTFVDTGSDAPSDLYTRLSLFGGAERGPWIVNSWANLEGRYILTGAGGATTGWQDLLGEADTYVYLRPDRLPSHTLVGRLSAAGGWRNGLPFQVTLGGRDGVRGFRTDRFPGGRRVLLTLEDRISYSWPAPDVFDFGTSVFFDVGRVWPGDAPFGVESEVQAAVGAGLRIGFPSETTGVVRIDIAAPITQPFSLSNLVIRFSAKERNGVSFGVYDEQMIRSRFTGLSGDVLVRRP
jgi:hypothetical protein